MPRHRPRIEIGNGALLAIQLGDIGDVVLTLPALNALKAAYPGNPLVICVRQKAAELVAGAGDQLLTVDKRKRAPLAAMRYQLDFLKRLRRQPVDLCIDFRTGTRGAIVARLSGARARLGFRATDEPVWRNHLFTHLLRKAYQPGTYVADYYFEPVKWLGIRSCGRTPVLDVPAAVKRAVCARLQRLGVDGTMPFVVVQPFSLWRYKELHADKYAGLIDRIGDRCGLPVILCGAPDERRRAQSIADRCSHGALNMAGRTSIAELAGLLSLAALFIGIDSAGLHIAAATGTPTVGIFGPSDPRSWAPRGERHTVIQPGLSCVPCRRKGCADSGVSRCLDRLSVAEMMATIGPLLDRAHQGRRGELRPPSNHCAGAFTAIGRSRSWRVP
jgi:heptosyltransferase-3